MVCLGSSWRNELLAPGSLIGPHARILAGSRYRERCAACHTAGDSQAQYWLVTALQEGSSDGTQQSDKCLACHDRQIPTPTALRPHSVPTEVLEQLTLAVDDNHRDLASIPNRSDLHDLQCALCHREHHGRNFDLTAVSNTQCQTCHARQFHSLADGHPEFRSTPKTSRTSIPFDHNRHRNKHFADKKHTFQCSTCHPPSASGDMVRRTSYEVGCADCHDLGIRATLGSEIDVIALPTIDLQSLAKHQIQLDRWPSQATGDFDGRLSLIARVLLGTEPAVRRALPALGPDSDFANIDPEIESQLRDAATIAREMGLLLQDLEHNATDAMLKRLERIGLAGPHQPASRTGTWLRNVDRFQIGYRPAVHGDSWLRTWLDTTAKLAVSDSTWQEVLHRSPEGLACTSCHRIVDGTINWQGRDDVPNLAAKLTRFRHEPHLLQPQLRDCSACHQLTSLAATDPQLPPVPIGQQLPLGEPAPFPGASTGSHAVSDFQPLRKQTCIGCHTPTGAGDRCVQCHRYHGGGEEG